MKLRLMIATAIGLGLGLGACDKKTESTATPSSEGSATAEAVKADESPAPDDEGVSPGDKLKGALAETGLKIDGVEQLAAKVDDAAAAMKNADKAPLDDAAYDKLILDHATCEVTADGNIDPKCPAVEAMREALSGGQALAALVGSESELGRKLITHESPAVRLLAVGKLRSITGTSRQNQDVIAAAGMTETSAGVLVQLVRAVAGDGAGNPKVAEMLLHAASSAEPQVRIQAIYAISGNETREMAGGAEKLITIMESDTDLEVRSAACASAGQLGDGRLVPAYKKLMAGELEPDLRTACLNGLVKMWWSYPHHETANEEAFNLTLELLGKKPRTKESPNWITFTHLGKRSESAFADWQSRAPWYVEAKLNKVLVDIVKDSNADWMARNGAVDVLVENGADADLKALLAGFPEKVEGDETHVRRKLTDAVAELQ